MGANAFEIVEAIIAIVAACISILHFVVWFFVWVTYVRREEKIARKLRAIFTFCHNATLVCREQISPRDMMTQWNLKEGDVGYEPILAQFTPEGRPTNDRLSEKVFRCMRRLRDETTLFSEEEEK